MVPPKGVVPESQSRRRGSAEAMQVDVCRTFPGEDFFPFTRESLQNFILLATSRALFLLNWPLCSGPSSDHSSTGQEKTSLSPGPMVLRETKSAQVICSPAHRILSPFNVCFLLSVARLEFVLRVRRSRWDAGRVAGPCCWRSKWAVVWT